MLPVGILPQPVFAPRVGNRAACRRADTHGDDQQLAFPCFLCNFERGIHRVFAITQDNQGIGAGGGGATFEILHGLAEHQTEIGAAHACPVAVYLLQRIAQGGVVVGEGND